MLLTHFKRSFVTGLILLLPATITFMIVSSLFNLLTTPFVQIVKPVLDKVSTHLPLFSNGFLFLSGAQIATLIAQLLILFGIILFITTVGLVARWFFVKWIMEYMDHLVQRTPFVGTMYNAIRDTTNTLFSSKTDAFHQVVLAPCPISKGYSIGLVAQDACSFPHHPEIEHSVAVFIPTTPNPTSGFLLLCRREELIYLDIPVRDAMKHVMSCGVVPLYPHSSRSNSKDPGS